MSFDEWQKQNSLAGFDKWQQENNSTAILDTDPNKAADAAGEVYDMAVDSNIPISEATAIYNSTKPKEKPVSDGLIKRFGKQFYNKTVADILHTLGKADTFGARDRAYELLKDWEKTNGRLTENIFNDQWNDWTYQLTQPPEARESNFLKSERTYPKPPSQVNPFEAEVGKAQTFGQKIVDAIAGILGFTTQVAVLRKAVPTMSRSVAFETVNTANGRPIGEGFAMEGIMAGMGKVIPGSGILPAVGRGTATSAIFGTTTYLGGGDATDILIQMGIPFAFEAAGMTKAQWAQYDKKPEVIASIKQRAPALREIDDILIEKAMGELLPSDIPGGTIAQKLKTSEQMKSEFTQTKPVEEISAEVKDYLQRKRYDELIQLASEGDKKAVKELNALVTGEGLPTYEQLLERLYNGDKTAADQIQAGNYFKGPAPRPELKLPRKQVADIEQQRPLSSIEQIKAQSPIIENDIKKPAKIDAAELGKARERGFVTSVKEVLPQLRIDNQYIPRPTDPLAIKARNLILDDIEKAERVALRGSSDTSIATASELIKYYGEQAEKAKNAVEADLWYERAATMANSTAEKLTELGRSVQAASILGRLTPEGQVRFAAREIQRYNEQVVKTKGGLGGLRKQIPELTKEQAKYILDEMKAIVEMPEGKDKAMRYQKLQNRVMDLVPTPLYRKMVTVWKAGLLTGIKTSGVNIVANAYHLGTESAKDIPAAAVDKVVSLFTGKRTIVASIKGLKKGGIEGTGKGLQYITTGYSERDIGTKLDFKRVNFGKGNTARALQAYTDTIFRLLGAEDQPFYYAAKLRSMYEQAKASAVNLGLTGAKAQAHIDNLIDNPTEQMIKYATKDAETAVFMNNTTLGDFARAFQRLPGGEFIVPFGRTPSAIAMQIVNYSPAGIPKTIIENIGKGRFDQRAFSQGIGRSITGIAVLAMGAKAYTAGILNLDYPKDERERKLWEAEGRVPNSIKIDGKWRSIQIFGPAGNLLIIGGQFQQAFEEQGSPTAAMSTALAGSAKSFTEQTFMKGVNQFATSLADPQRSAPMVVGDTIASIIPTIISDVARVTDTTERRPETITERIKARIPVVRRTLEPKVTVLGEEKQATANPLEIMIDPTRPSKPTDNPIANELRRLWDEGWQVAPAQLGKLKGYDVLTPQENTILWKRTGVIVKSGLTQLINNPLYKELPDEKKAELITTLTSEAQKAAKAEIVGRKLTGLKGEELAKTIYDLRKSGLADEDLINIALSKQKPEAVRKLQKRAK